MSIGVSVAVLFAANAQTTIHPSHPVNVPKITTNFPKSCLVAGILQKSFEIQLAEICFPLNIKRPDEASIIDSFLAEGLIITSTLPGSLEEVEKKTLMGTADGPGITEFALYQEVDKGNEVDPHAGKYDPARIDQR